MSKKLYLIAVVILAVLLVVACGGEEPKAEPTAAPAAQEVAAAPVGDAANGGKIFATACVACHGPEAKGVTGLGKDLTTSEWVGTQSDAQLVEFIKKGRDPPKGGNPAMSEQEIADIVAFVRSIHQN